MSSLAFFNRRLATAQAASELPASARFDLAFSDMDDDTLEQTVGMFGGPEYGSGGFGMTDVIDEFLSRDPKFLTVDSLSQYQQNLKDSGYLSPDYPVTGTWDAMSSAASRRSERDTTDLIRGGAHLGAVSVQKGLGYLAAAVPQEIFKGVWAAVKGTAENVGTFATNPLEAVEEGGALGTGAAGAVVGFAVGGPVGAAVGGLIGGGLGLAADFFDWGGEEDDPEGINALWDALSPYDEYRSTGAKNFFAMLDTVLLGATALKAGQIGVKGVQAALKAPSLTAGSLAPTVAGARTAGGMVLPTVTQQSTRSVAQAGFKEAFMRSAPGTMTPGLVGKMTASALKRPVLGGASIGALVDATPELLAGEWGDALEQGIRGATVGGLTLGAAAKTEKGQALIGGLSKFATSGQIKRITDSGAGQVLRAGYTSAAMVSTGGRITADITPGEDPLQKGIEEAPDWGKVGDAIDLTVGSLLYPNRILPILPREVGDAFRAMDNMHALMPFYRAQAQIDNVRIDDDLIRRVDSALGLGDSADRVTVATNAYRMYLDKALDTEAARFAQMEFPDQTSGSVLGRFRLQAKEREIRARLVKQAVDESESGPSRLASQLLEDSLNKPLSMQNEVVTWQGRGTSIDDLGQETRAQTLLDDMRPEGEFRVMPALRDDPSSPTPGFLTRQKVVGIRQGYEEATQQLAFAKRLNDNHVAQAQGAGVVPNPLYQTQVDTALQVFDDSILEMRRFDLIDDGDLIDIRSDMTTVNQKVTKRLDEIAELRPVENQQLSDALAAQGLDRYIAVNTGENMLVTSDVPRLLRYEGIDQVVRHPVREFFAGMARKPDDYFDLGPMRYQSISAAMDQVSVDHNLGLTGNQLTRRLYDFVRQRSEPRWAEQHLGEKVTTGRKTPFVYRENIKTGEVKREVLKMDPRDLTPEDINKALRLDEMDHIDDPFAVADAIKRNVAVGAAFGADAMNPFKTLRELGRGLQIQGLTAFQDYARTIRAPLHRWTGQTERKFDELTGFSAKAKKGSWGYVPENLRKLHLTFQFSLSPSFDVSRYMESMSFGARYGISPKLVINPRKFVRTYKDGFVDPLTGERVSGERALLAMNRFADHAIYGRNTMQSLDDLQFRAHNAGIAGFKPREVEAAQAMVLAQRYAKKGPLSTGDLDEIRERLLTINRYGKGQSAYAKSAHFIFFPFLFQAKQMNLIMDTVLDAPTRVALMHEGFRRWYGIDGDEGLKERFGTEVVEKHLPILKELGRWNNLSYGVSAGRFFLDGLLDSKSVDGRAAMDRSTYGKITQGLTQFFLPGGIHTPVGETAGQLTDWVKQLWAPVVIYDDGENYGRAEQFLDTFERAIPMWRDANRWFFDNRNLLEEQSAGLAEGMTPSYQFTEYIENRSMLKQTFEQIATAAGYSSWDSLRQSDAGAQLADLYDQGQDMLRGEYPSGAELATKFIDTDESRKVAMVVMADKGHRTDAEEAILQLGLMEETINALAADKGISQETMRQIMAPAIRSFGLSMAGDRQFLNLYENLGYASMWGPLRVVAA